MPSNIVFITGCSTGIGQDLARRLALADYTVVATARHPETLADLPAALKLALDVLVNNAGYAVRGAVEEVSDEQVHAMFDVNVYGVMRMVRAVAPHMRQQRAGRIVTIGSVAGKLALPVNGTYSATKFAVEALSDALRLELAPFGIQVVLVEPGNIRTNFMATAQAHAQATLSSPGSPYHALYQRYLQVMAAMREREPGPEVVSQAIQQAIEAPHPKSRYLVAVPWSNRLGLLLGDSIKDFIFRRMFKIASSAE